MTILLYSLIRDSDLNFKLSLLYIVALIIIIIKYYIKKHKMCQQV